MGSQHSRVSSQGISLSDVLTMKNNSTSMRPSRSGNLSTIVSLGIAPSLNASTTQAMAQAAHGSAPDIAGQCVANPVAMILSTSLLLDWLGKRNSESALRSAAELISRSVESVVANGVATIDLGGMASTRDFSDAVVRCITNFKSSTKA